VTRVSSLPLSPEKTGNRDGKQSVNKLMVGKKHVMPRRSLGDLLISCRALCAEGTIYPQPSASMFAVVANLQPNLGAIKPQSTVPAWDGFLPSTCPARFAGQFSLVEEVSG
jgi:hypothetical protein